MKREQMKPLNLDDGFESIVNPKTAQRRNREGKKVRRWLLDIVVLLSVILINLLLWVANVIPAVPSLWITGICVCVVSFLAGRLWEVCSR